MLQSNAFFLSDWNSQKKKRRTKESWNLRKIWTTIHITETEKYKAVGTTK